MQKMPTSATTNFNANIVRRPGEDTRGEGRRGGRTRGLCRSAGGRGSEYVKSEEDGLDDKHLLLLGEWLGEHNSYKMLVPTRPHTPGSLSITVLHTPRPPGRWVPRRRPWRSSATSQPSSRDTLLTTMLALST